MQNDLRARATRSKNVAVGKEAVDDVAARTILVSISGTSLGSHPAAVGQATLVKMEELLGVQLQPAPAGSALLPGQWSSTMPLDAAWDGRFRVFLHTAEEVQQLHSHLHGMPLWTGSGWCHLAISNAAIASWNAPRQQPQRPTLSAPMPGGAAVRGGGRPARR